MELLGFLKKMVTALANKNKLNEAIQADDALQNAMDIAKTVGGVGGVLQPLGQMFVRIGLFMTKQKKLHQRRPQILIQRTQ